MPKTSILALCIPMLARVCNVPNIPYFCPMSKNSFCWRAFVTRARSLFAPIPKTTLIALCLLIALAGCQTSNWTQLHLNNLQNEPVELTNFAQTQTVFIFLSPECPLCQNYSVKINQLLQQHRSDSLHFVGVVSGTFYPQEQINRYLVKYDLDLPVLLDPEFKLAKALGAEITPEAFYTAPGGEVLYRGAIDDWAISLGQKRINVQNDYLHDAIVAYQNRSPIDPKKTKAVGCFIE